jgi:malonyl-CoA decarboxylase
VLKAARAYAETPGVATQVALTLVAEPPRQELFRRLNRMPGGTAAILRLRRALLHALPRKPELAAIEADLLDLLTSWFNPGFLQKRRVDWNSPAQLLEKIIHHEAVHAIDGWDDLRRRLQPDRRCFAFFHPGRPGHPPKRWPSGRRDGGHRRGAVKGGRRDCGTPAALCRHRRVQPARRGAGRSA